MLNGRNIAFFIDVDNVGLKRENYDNVLNQLRTMGNVLVGKVYGATERKHKEIIIDADANGYKIERPLRLKRRGRKEFDPRIFVDVVDVVSQNKAIDAVCIVAQPADLVYLYSYLRARNIKIIALDNADDASCALIDEVIDLGIVLELKLPKTNISLKRAAPKASKVAHVEQPVVEEMTVEEPIVADEEEPDFDDADLDRTDDLLKEIERLKALVNSPITNDEMEDEPAPAKNATAPVSKTAEHRKPETAVKSAKKTTAKSVEKTVEKAEEPTPTMSEPNAPYATTNDSDLIRRIEEIRRNSQGDDDDFVDEIRKLLDGLE